MSQNRPSRERHRGRALARVELHDDVLVSGVAGARPVTRVPVMTGLPPGGLLATPYVGVREMTGE